VNTLHLCRSKAWGGREIYTCTVISAFIPHLSIPEHPFYQKKFGWKTTDFPNAMSFGRETVSLPLSAKLTEQDIEDVVEAVKNILGKR